ncbi:MAG: hypothetical protein H0V97_08235 [Actinobacteria bacterium]|nr:hypothetical protein [Actinomycetota bacterium]
MVRARRHSVTALFWAQSPTPSPSIIQTPPADPLQTIGAIVAIAFALAAAIIGYRIIRGGRGL